jgi:hypothetical protein
MSKLINAKINLDKIKDDLLFVGEKGTYLDVSIWLNDEPDQYGNDISIQQTTKKGEPKIYLGQGKYSVKKETEQDIEAKSEWRKGKTEVKSMSDISQLPGADIVPESEEPLF